MIIVPIEDGISNATKNLDEAAEAAPTSELVDENDFGLNDEDSDGNHEPRSTDEDDADRNSDEEQVDSEY